MRPPSPWRRHWKLAIGFPLVVALLLGTFGSRRVRALSSSDRVERALPVDDVGGGVADVLDASRVHTVTLRWRDEDYRRMLAAYVEGGEKEWFEADLVIDGVEVPGVGLRLQGDGALAALRIAEGRTAPNGPGSPAGDDGFGAAPSAEEPEDLPWLVSFDAFVAGRRFQGHEELALRPGPKVTHTTALNEALSLALLADAGEPAPAFAWSSVTVNDRPATLRLLLQHPGDSQVADDFEHDGPLYAARSTGRFEYRGEDPLAYTESFDQLTNRRQQDLQPLIDLVRWVTTSTDGAFAAGLADRVDVAAFARYLALQHLLLNADDMAGPGQDYLLFYDTVTERFSVLAWDLNAAMIGDPTRGPFDEAGAVAGEPVGGHVLKERFLATEAFRSLYERTYRDLYRTYVAGGRAGRLLDDLAATLATVDPAVAAPFAVEADVAEARAFLADRRIGLAADPVVAG